MAKLVFGMNMSLDGYVDHTRFAPSLELFQHFVQHMQEISGIIYGRGMYEVMRYWDEDQPEWEQHEHDFAAGWRARHKWVISRTLQTVGPNATLVSTDVEETVRGLKAELPGEIGITGPVLAHSLNEAGLIDEYRIYLHPVVLGSGRPFFAGAQPPLRFAGSERITDQVIRLTYLPR